MNDNLVVVIGDNVFIAKFIQVACDGFSVGADDVREFLVGQFNFNPDGIVSGVLAELFAEANELGGQSTGDSFKRCTLYFTIRVPESLGEDFGEIETKLGIRMEEIQKIFSLNPKERGIAGCFSLSTSVFVG